MPVRVVGLGDCGGGTSGCGGDGARWLVVGIGGSKDVGIGGSSGDGARWQWR